MAFDIACSCCRFFLMIILSAHWPRCARWFGFPTKQNGFVLLKSHWEAKIQQLRNRTNNLIGWYWYGVISQQLGIPNLVNPKVFLSILWGKSFDQDLRPDYSFGKAIWEPAIKEAAGFKGVCWGCPWLNQRYHNDHNVTYELIWMFNLIR